MSDAERLPGDLLFSALPFPPPLPLRQPVAGAARGAAAAADGH